ncbi:MAG: hypothetical protein IPH18_12300 [Chitinophagaceae bacterium]|nr:hypothetical protein [Chitinophagaceae bacterium]MBK8951930.1 hypothetical protein [Chitinophagaceae bacterium]
MTSELNRLHVAYVNKPAEQPLIIRWIAKGISYFFHPVFVPVYVIWFLLFVHPSMFTGFSPFQKTRLLVMAFVSFTFFPLVTVFLLRALKFIDSILLKTQKDRIIPLIACMIWYFWIWYVWSNFGKTRDVVDIPRPVVQFAFATFFTTIIALMLNIKMKVSLHTIATGVMLTSMLILAYTEELNFGLYLAIAFLITGLVATARLIASDHTTIEIYAGLATGAVSMLIAWTFA